MVESSPPSETASTAATPATPRAISARISPIRRPRLPRPDGVRWSGGRGETPSPISSTGSTRQRPLDPCCLGHFNGALRGRLGEFRRFGTAARPPSLVPGQNGSRPRRCGDCASPAPRPARSRGRDTGVNTRCVSETRASIRRTPLSQRGPRISTAISTRSSDASLARRVRASGSFTSRRSTQRRDSGRARDSPPLRAGSPRSRA